MAKLAFPNWLRVPAIRAVTFCFMISHAGVLVSQEAGNTEPAQAQSFLWWLVHVSGAMGAVILAISLYFVAILVRAFLDIRVSNAIPRESVEFVDKMIEERNIKELFDFVQKDDSSYSNLLVAGIGQLKYGLDEAREKIERSAEATTAEMERSVSDLAVIGSLGPLLGLLGTLKGMIASFSVIAISGVALDPGKVAEGISEALVLTFEGVMLSVPAIYCYSLFRNRISKIHIDCIAIADDQIRLIAKLVKSSKATEAAS